MKEQYEKPVVELVIFESEDVITCSGNETEIIPLNLFYD